MKITKQFIYKTKPCNQMQKATAGVNSQVKN